MLGLPFVVEQCTDGTGRLREYLVDCPPLGVHRVWLVVRTDAAECEALAFVVYEGGVSVVRLTSIRATDPASLEAAVMLAYESAFLARSG